MNRTRQFAVLVGLLLLGPAWSSAQEVLRTKASNVIERFQVNRGGDILLLPVKINNKTYQFFVDTGSTEMVYDASLPLGPAKEIRAISTGGGDIEMKFFDPPKGTLGKLKLPTDEPIAGYDFGKLREITGYEVYGVVGMRMLKKHIIRIDFDQGEIQFLKSLPSDADKYFSLAFENHCPVTNAHVEGIGRLPFLIDTGFVGRSLTLAPHQFSALSRASSSRVVATTLEESAAGTKNVRLLQSKTIAVDDFSLASLVSSEGNINSIGLGLLRRFVVTFDFPNGKMYLRKGKAFGDPDIWTLSGLHLLRRSGCVIVDSVDEGRAAAIGGIKTGDKISKVGDKSAAEFSMFELRRLLSQPGTVDLVIERDGRLHSMKLALKQ